MTRTAFEDRITADLRRLAEFAPDDNQEPLPLVEAREVRTTRRRRIALSAGAAIVGVAAITGVLAVLTRDSGDTDAGNGSVTAPQVFEGSDRWQELPPGPADGRTFPAFVWANDQLIVWGGETVSETEWTNTGAVFDASSGSWREMASGPLAARSEHSAVWMGDELFVCCGRVPSAENEADAAAYDPLTDTWRSLPPAPAPVAFASAVWTGTKVLLVGTYPVGYPANTRAMTFDPAAETWQVFEGPPAALGPQPQLAWTGSDAIVWAGASGSAGFVLDPERGRWDPLPQVPPELALVGPSMVATRDTVLIWGASVSRSSGSAGARFDRSTGRWTAMADDPLGTGDDWEGVAGSSTAVWTGTEMVIWAGAVASLQAQTTTRTIAYSPATDTWRELDRAPVTAYRPEATIGDGWFVINDQLGAPLALRVG